MFSVIIPNWNGLRFLPTYLDALRTQTYRNFETIVVDDCSTDGSREFIAKEFPEVRVIAQETNRGFASAVNAGIRVARGEIIVLLNNDTEADPHWLEEIARALELHPTAGMVVCKLKLYDKRDCIHSAGDFYRVDGIPGNRGVWEQDRGQYDDARGVFGGCGGAVAYRKSMLDEIGLFDEALIANLEDVDLNWRARLAGYPVAYAPRAIVYHMVSATGGGAYGSFLVGRNFIWVIAKNYPRGLWKKYWRAIVAAQLKITWDALKSWRGAAARARLRGQLAGLVGLSHWINRRKETIRRASEQDIEAVLTPLSRRGGER
ncbi:MAG: glycosyltransferase family 2 protein [Chloroflexi bacterium]|nr:glycosyltransferase family 2 protein [Chloroflexota bacterium]